jgi:hypothetical protein
VSIEFTKVEETTRQAFFETLLTFWDQHWKSGFRDEFLAWRYTRRSEGETLVAMSGSKCIGLIDTFIRPYRVGARTVLVREPCDWYCLPGNRGIGMRLMKYLIAQGEPILGVGLPKALIAIAPRLKWKHLLDAHDFILPITARRVAGTVLRKAGMGDGSIAKYLPRSLRLRSTSAWTKHREIDGEVEEISPNDWLGDNSPIGEDDGEYALTPILTKKYAQWLRSGPTSLGPVRCFAFRERGSPAGLSVSRIEASKVGYKLKLIHLQAFKPNVRTLRWMIAENVLRAAEFDAESVHCRSSCPITSAALTSLGFYRTAKEAVMIGFNDLPTPSGPVNVTLLRGDDAMIPSLIGE